MKTDTYLNLCLEQAELSPLHHRHGCIVVKGGKVIGKGFNDYRSGFDGGALKTGILPSKSFALDKLDKLKPKGKDDGGFKPFESIFNETHRPNYVLSMHSEMMAINSALATSSTLAATTLSRFKPALAPSRRSKQKRQLRRDILTAYAQTITGEAYHGPQSQNLNYQHGTKGKKQQKQRKQQQEQQQQQQQESYYQHDYYDAKYNTFQCNDDQTERPKTSILDDKLFDGSAGDGPLPRQGKSTRRGISSTARVQNKNAHGGSHPESSPAVHNLSDRMKNLKLVGADIYIARLGNIQHQSKKRTKINGKRIILTVCDSNSKEEDTCCSSIPLERTTSPSGSLHDELKCKDRKSPSPAQSLSDNVADPGFDRRQLRDSRPCYRCVAYMHSAGIRRCFWTNGEGEWVNAKVRDLFDQLMGTGSFDGDGDDSPGGVFITKHEVLRMRRQVGEGK
ncbi:hypothetical protein SLS62_007162 [Diatrype stigma]|uniref:CMP/dCMP-type deaminase domain-containing protein n=1 Tax=Diatrype stigma TaxID=117547 RepID=A0AAN9UX82_9PEZI